MSLYLAIFDGNDEIDGVEIGRYADFDFFLETIANKLEKGVAGSKYPILNLQFDFDYLWTPEAAVLLERELTEIATCLKALPPVDFNSDWQKNVAKSIGSIPKNLFECFIDVDGEYLIERLINLTKISQQLNLPILFQ